MKMGGEWHLCQIKTNLSLPYKKRELSYAEAVLEAQAGILAGVNAFKGRDGETYIRGDADGDPSNNLDNLPLF
jgi:hypothetical protein